MTKWQLQEAKARFCELIDDTLEKGPQVVTRRGIDTAVVVSIDEWHKSKDENRSNWKDVKVPGQQLRSLATDGIVVHTAYPQVPPKFEYRLTPWGQSHCPALDTILKWAEPTAEEK